jgi:hypothetical protein
MLLKLKDIKSNPYRDLKANPLIEQKVLDLMDSINLTGFWENIVVRKNAEGKYELAYGHHRLAAAIRAGITEADFIVKDFDDAKMIQVMDNENRETYGSTPLSLIESVKAVVQSLAKGVITLEVDPRTPAQYVRYAPSYVPGKKELGRTSTQIPYTAMSIAVFLGRTKSREQERNNVRADEGITAALNALHLQEMGHFNKSMLVTKDRTGAVVPITTNELLKITGDIKRDVERTEKTKEQTRKAEAEVTAEQIRLEKERKEHQRKAEAEYEASIKKEADAKREANKKEVERLRKEREDKAEAQLLKEIADSEKKVALEKRLREIKQKAEEQAKKDEYAPIRREVESIVFKLEADPSFAEECKALSRRKLTPEDRERIRQAALKRGSWYSDYFSNLFLPPMGVRSQLTDYRRREEAKRRAEEAKEIKKEKKKK